MADASNSGTNLRVSRGDPLAISAAWVNETSQRNADVRKIMAMLSRGDRNTTLAPTQSVVVMQNNSGANRMQGEILGFNGLVLAAPTTTPTDPQTSSFFYRPVIAGSKPTSASNFGLFAVCLDPIATGQFGRCVISGMCAVQINLVNNSDNYADVTNNDSTQLTSGPIGGAKILYAPSGTGKQLCWACIGGPVNAPAMVMLSQNGGVSGTDGSATCSFTYDVKPLGGGTKWNTSALTPKNSAARIPNLKYTAATLGMAYVDFSGSNALAIITLNEAVADTANCST